jgi:uncharacterized repeat protein (TIGR01451 family)
MRSWKRWEMHWLPVLALIGVLLVLPPLVVQGAPPAQGSATPTPTPLVPPRPIYEPGTTPGSGGSEGAVSSRISLALAVDRAEAKPGDVLRYKAQIANAGGEVATNVWLTCDLPEQVEIQEISITQGQVHYYGRRVSVEVGKLSPGFTSQFVTILARIRDDVEPGTELVHHANLTSDQAGGGEAEARTTIAGEEQEPTPVPQEAAMLPVSGSGSLPLWLIAALGTSIIAVALLGRRGHIH